MTKIIVFKNDDMITGFQVKGHSGYAQSGQDIVCSAISVACQMTVVGLKEVLGKNIDFQQREAFMLVRVAEEDWIEAQDFLKTLELTLVDIAKNYSRFVKMEVKKDVY